MEIQFGKNFVPTLVKITTRFIFQQSPSSHIDKIRRMVRQEITSDTPRPITFGKPVETIRTVESPIAGPTQLALTPEREVINPPVAKVEPTAAKSIATGCLPCFLGHAGTCSGLLNEAVRFSDNGLADDQVIQRINMCLDELNAMERVDLRPEMITQLSGWEKELAEKALKFSRDTRHGLEGLANGGKKEDLEALAATMQTNRQDIGRTWFKSKLQNMTPDEKVEMQKKIIAKLEEPM